MFQMYTSEKIVCEVYKLSDLMLYDDIGSVCITGDVNNRVGELIDDIPFNDVNT